MLLSRLELGDQGRRRWDLLGGWRLLFTRSRLCCLLFCRSLARLFRGTRFRQLFLLQLLSLLLMLRLLASLCFARRRIPFAR